VLDEFRRHTGYVEAKGVELEDDGGEGSANSHWEKRIMGNDIMVADLVEDITVSVQTLKVFETLG